MQSQSGVRKQGEKRSRGHTEGNHGQMAGLEVALKTTLAVVAGGDIVFQSLSIVEFFFGECFFLHGCVVLFVCVGKNVQRRL